MVAERGTEIGIAARSDHHLLATSPFVAHRRGPAARRQASLPQLIPGLDVEGAQVIVHCRPDEDEAASSRNRAAYTGHAERDGARPRALRSAQDFAPDDVAAGEVYAGDDTPRGGEQGIGRVGTLGPRASCQMAPLVSRGPSTESRRPSPMGKLVLCWHPAFTWCCCVLYPR